ncbi:MAG: MIP/aquaporin family protein [Pseudonocardiaceae bacterium]
MSEPAARPQDEPDRRKYATLCDGVHRDIFLVLTVGTTALREVAFAPLAIGAVLMVMVYAGGHISGGHYNPAVTLGVFLRGALRATDVGPYWVAQIAGATLGSYTALYLVGDSHPQALSFSGGHIAVALVAEFLFTFALVWVVLNVATSKDHEVNSFYGLAIGFTVVVGAFAVGAITGGAFNPAVAIGTAVMGLASWSALWIYLVANLLGGAVAAFAFRFCNPEDVSTQATPVTDAQAVHSSAHAHIEMN